MGLLTDQFEKFQSRREQYLEVAGVRPKFQRVASWHEGAPAIRKPSKSAGIRVDPSHARDIAELIETAAPAVAAAFTRHLVPVADFAQREWPEDSGFSKSLLGLDFVALAGGGEFAGRVTNIAPYSWYIQSPRSVVLELIFKPGEEAARRIEADIADGIG